MVKAADHYHRIEVPSCQTERTVYKSSLTLPDVEYNLTRLEGQLIRLEMLAPKDKVSPVTETLLSARGFLNALKLALSKDRIDVA